MLTKFLCIGHFNPAKAVFQSDHVQACEPGDGPDDAGNQRGRRGVHSIREQRLSFTCQGCDRLVGVVDSGGRCGVLGISLQRRTHVTECAGP